MINFLTTRNLFGSLFLLVLVGEPAVGYSTGLFTPLRFVIFYIFYFLIFLIFESIIDKYDLTIYQLILLNFIIYAVIITGFFHAEIADYVLKPGNFIVTTLIRIQSGMFVPYAYVLLNKYFPRKEKRGSFMKPRTAVGLFLIYMLILSRPTGKIGFTAAFNTLLIAPLWSLFYIFLALIAYKYTFTKEVFTTYKDKKLFYISVLLFGIGMLPIPNVLWILLLFIATPIATLLLSMDKGFLKSSAYYLGTTT